MYNTTNIISFCSRILGNASDNDTQWLLVTESNYVLLYKMTKKGMVVLTAVRDSEEFWLDLKGNLVGSASESFLETIQRTFFTHREFQSIISTGFYC